MDLKRVNKWDRKLNSIVLYLEQGAAEISFVEKDIIRLRYHINDEFEEDMNYILCDDLEPLDVFTVEKDNALEIETESIAARITLNPFMMDITMRNKSIISSSDPFISFNQDQKTIRFSLNPEERIYGLGQDPMANLDVRDKERRMWQQWGSNRRSGNNGIPFMMSSNGYGILLNSSWASRFAIGKAQVAERHVRGDEMAPAPRDWDHDSDETNPDETAIITEDGDLDLFIIVKPSMDDLLNGYCRLTGYPPLLPKWALGFMQCKNRYRSQKELISIAKTLREKNIPCDVLIIDWLWFKEFGDLEWFKKDWPDPEGMLQKLSQMGFKVMQAQHPFIEKNSLKYETFEKAGFLNKIPEGARPTFDHSNPEARKAWWHEIERLYKQGIKGYWTDMGELEQHLPGTESYMGCREKVHNIYSTLWVKGLYEGQRSVSNDRVFSLPRTAFAGIQKYSAGMWSGDIDASWEVFKDQVVIGQGVCLSGQPYWTTDIGGFFTSNEFSPELYIRWFEWGIFCPLFRTHGTRPGNEPWSFGAHAEQIIKRYIQLRYELMPYIYSHVRQVSVKGRPFMRAMCMDYPDDPIAVEKIHQFTFGSSILVAPVLEKGSRIKNAYLPEGVWYDYWTEHKYIGSKDISVAAPLDRIPLFIKAGSIIPNEDPKDYAEKECDSRLLIHIYPGKDTCFELYEDDGMTYQYEKGEYAKTLIEYIDQSRPTIKIHPVQGGYEKMPKSRSYNIILHDAKHPVSVVDRNRNAVEWTYDDKKRILSIQDQVVEANEGMDITIMCKEDDRLPVTPEMLNIAIYADVDMASDGDTSVHLIIDARESGDELTMKTRLLPPHGWAIEGEKKKQSSLACDRCVALEWMVKPSGEALPLKVQGCIETELLKYGIVIMKDQKQIEWGTEYITRWSVVGTFDNKDNKGLECSGNAVEADPDAPYYANGNDRVYWMRDPDVDFNCFGYMDLRKLGMNTSDGIIHGIAFSKCKVWAPADVSLHAEISSEAGIKLLINGQEIITTYEPMIDELIQVPVKLMQGWNNILIKSSVFTEKPYSGREFGFNIHFVDENLHVVNDLLYKV